MLSTQLERKQLETMLEHFKREAHYLDCLTGRMHQCQFPTSDRMRMLAGEAQAAIHALCEELERLAKTAK
jgi:hypothetical protein